MRTDVKTTSVCFRPYVKAGKMSIVELNSEDPRVRREDYFMTDVDGNYLQFATEAEAVAWVWKNVKTELIHDDYLDKLTKPAVNRTYWLKDEVLQKEKVEGSHLDTYRLYAADGKVDVVRILDEDVTEYDMDNFITDRNGYSLIFSTEDEAIDWLIANVKPWLIHPTRLLPGSDTAPMKVKGNLSYWLK
ncbi:hypothetical protein [Bacillus cereus]|uniref:hypothetical protein n=1 Tax=Bacillus cereus TaxID=1396 RepID=UPI001C8C41F2|nr:hypothetical protein [Bacillus cereus]MBX9158494.1 hypothetical protein [Bacillus cereus]